MDDAVRTRDLLPDAATLFRMHRAHQAVMIVLAILGAVVAVFLWLEVIGAGFVTSHPWLTGFIFVYVAQRTLMAPVILALYLPRVTIGKAKPSDLGALSPERLQSIVEEVGLKLPGRETPRLYIVRGALAKEVNAFTINSLFSNIVGPWNAVYVTRDLLRLLREDEVRAILGHELAHFRGLMHLVARMHGLWTLGVATLIIALFAAVPDLATWHWLFQGLTVIALAIVGDVLLRVLVAPMREVHEFLADYESARIFGHIPLMNALLRLTVREEIMTEVLYQALVTMRSNPKLKLAALINACAEQIPPGDVPLSQVQRIVASVLEPLHGGEDILAEDDAAGPPSRRKLRKRLRKALRLFRGRKRWRKIDWHAFDTLRPDGRLDEEEMDGYIDALAADPAGLVAYLPSERRHVPNDLLHLTHPTFRRRLLFLAREFASRQPVAVETD